MEFWKWQTSPSNTVLLIKHYECTISTPRCENLCNDSSVIIYKLFVYRIHFLFKKHNYIPWILSLIQLWPDRFYLQCEERNSQVRQSPKWRWIHHPRVQSWPKWWLQSWHRCISSNFCNVEKPFCFFEISIPVKRQKFVCQVYGEKIERYNLTRKFVCLWLCKFSSATLFLEGSQLNFSQQKKKEVKKQIWYYKVVQVCMHLLCKSTYILS